MEVRREVVQITAMFDDTYLAEVKLQNGRQRMDILDLKNGEVENVGTAECTKT